MKIYIGHSRGSDYQKNLYDPIRNSQFDKQHEIVLPHEESFESRSSKDFLKTCDLMIAEVSFPATGLGIELGWADCLGCPIICIYKKGSKISNSLKGVTNKFIEYADEREMVDLLGKSLKSMVLKNKINVL